MGAQESILKSAVTTIIPKESRAMGFGVFETIFGLFWFIGSWLMGYLYDVNISYMVMLSIGMQLLSIPCLYVTMKLEKENLD